MNRHLISLAMHVLKNGFHINYGMGLRTGNFAALFFLLAYCYTDFFLFVYPFLFYLTPSNAGNGPVTRLFEGQRDHLIPCASQQLLDSDLFIMAGRMVGHSFIHGGPSLAGLSPAVVHMLSGRNVLIDFSLDNCC